jgi:hypothetical protein
MKVGGICGECGKYYRGEVCPADHLSTYSGRTLNFINDIPEHFNRGLGKVIKSRNHYRAECREANVIEVGNERNYISPEYNEKLQEAKVEKSMKEARPEAYKVLAHMEGNPQWN